MGDVALVFDGGDVWFCYFQKEMRKKNQFQQLMNKKV
jgi:hypothetical protein